MKELLFAGLLTTLFAGCGGSAVKSTKIGAGACFRLGANDSTLARDSSSVAAFEREAGALSQSIHLNRIVQLERKPVLYAALATRGLDKIKQQWAADSAFSPLEEHSGETNEWTWTALRRERNDSSFVRVLAKQPNVGANVVFCASAPASAEVDSFFTHPNIIFDRFDCD